jgi:hypothetical protein
MSSDKIDLTIGLLLLSIATAYLTIIRNKTDKFFKLFARKGYIIEVALIATWAIIILKLDGLNLFDKSSSTLKRLKLATTHGTIALIISTLAYLELTTPTFWFVILAAYYIDTPITGVY